MFARIARRTPRPAPPVVAPRPAIDIDWSAVAAANVARRASTAIGR